ncbi:hypothetical protein HMPREF9371_0874 [Neisseria shayeganii 871]|uniref:Uncharacterized protein n=1 Tax=Neisseria shayeganii 871 TaxID=1032488 RepID=G4CGY5_9NEIS|nr:hypothetical protein HMPREF9371_0874 [Neisseria shayeganii 871]
MRIRQRCTEDGEQVVRLPENETRGFLRSKRFQVARFGTAA